MLIGTNYDGTTAGKKWQAPGGGRSRPRNCLDRSWAVPGLLIPGFAALAATTERVVVNRFTGLAIEGFDPVAYFIDGRPVRDRPDFEASQAGAVWRFRNEGNRASFVAHPEIYGAAVRRLRPGRRGPRRDRCRQPAVLAGLGPAALSVRPRGQPRCLRRRSRKFPAAGASPLAELEQAWLNRA